MDTDSLSIVNQKYGSKSGFLKHSFYYFTQYLGLWRSYQVIDFHDVKRLVFVCSGNICRSPIARKLLEQAGVESISFGLHCTKGARANETALKIARRYDIDIEDHRATPVSEYLASKNDLVIGMEPRHMSYFENFDCQRSLLGLWGDPPAPYIHDPYMTNEEYFDICVRRIISCSNALSDRLS